jgi:hypothetical protein
MSVAFQEFYDSIEDELRKDKSWAGYTQRRPSVDDDGDNVGEQANASEHDLVEQRVEGAMELVESCIAIVFYDQWAPKTVDPTAHTDNIVVVFSSHRGQMMPRTMRRWRTALLH